MTRSKVADPPVTVKLAAEYNPTNETLAKNIEQAIESLAKKSSARVSVPDKYRIKIFDILLSDMKDFPVGVGRWERSEEFFRVSLYEGDTDYEIDLNLKSAKVSAMDRVDWSISPTTISADAALCFRYFPKNDTLSFRVVSSEGGIPSEIEAWVITNVAMSRGYARTSLPVSGPYLDFKYNQYSNGWTPGRETYSLRTAGSIS